ncbi:MAG: TldD/PmbA family protein [Acidimicrobiales bacterium]
MPEAALRSEGCAELASIAERIVGWARAGEEVEAYVSQSRSISIRAYAGEVESLSSAQTSGVGIRVVCRERQGFAYAGSLDPDVLAETLAEARDNASFATPDPHVGLAAPDGVGAVPLDLWADDLAECPTQDKVAMALDLEARVKAADPRIRLVQSADYGDGSGEAAVASTAGISVTSRGTGCYLSASAVAGSGDETQTAGGYSVARGLAGLDPERCAYDAVERSTRLLGARKAASGRITVVLDRRVTTTLLGLLAGTLSGEAVEKGRSLFADRVGERVGVAGITLIDDPTDPAAYGASTHDAEGLACRRNVLIEGGVLQGFVYDSYSGRRAGRSSTGSAVRGGFRSTPGVGCQAVALSPGELSQAEVIDLVGEGMLVQSITGVHSGVNPVSGDFSVGAEGLMIRGGSLAEPVREVTIASTIQRMLADVVAVGADLEWGLGVAAGVTLAIAEVSLSGS